jgi:hypothetical protein
MNRRCCTHEACSLANEQALLQIRLRVRYVLAAPDASMQMSCVRIFILTDSIASFSDSSHPPCASIATHWSFDYAKKHRILLMIINIFFAKG